MPRILRLVGLAAGLAVLLATPDAARSTGPQEASKDPGGVRFGRRESSPRPAGTIRLATYNVLNLFDAEDDPDLSGAHEDMAMVTPPERCRMLAAAIRAVDCDILALQEVESIATLTWFRDQFLADMGYRYLESIDVRYKRGVECSIMSRFPITDARVWVGLPLDEVRRAGPGWCDVPADGRRGLTIQRSPLMVRIAVNPDYELTVFSVHHKSGRDYAWKREAEALKIVELVRSIEAEHPDWNIVVMGDFNAAPTDKSLRVYLEAGLIDTLAQRALIPPEGRPQTEAALYVTHESGRILDYILLNSAACREFVVGSAFVYGTRTPPDSYDWRSDPYPPGYASDHYPVVVDLTPVDRR